MITTLLWRCPLCRTDDQMRAERRFLQPASVSCRACGTRWRIRRQPGKDYRLAVTAGDPEIVGIELPLAEWYARLKASVTLVPQPIPIPGPLEGEEVYASDSHVTLIVRRETPLPNPGESRSVPALWPKEVPLQSAWDSAGEGSLYLTNRRLIWERPQGGYDLYWSQVRSAFTFLSRYYGILYGQVAYRFQPPRGRLLKWLTYTARLAEATGQAITVSYH